MSKSYGVIIIGAGTMGMASGYYLSKQGISTLMIDAFDPPHSYGSHLGDTRIIRHAYGESREYVPLALRSQELWCELEKDTNSLLFEQTGVLGIGAEGSPFIQEEIESASQYSLSLEIYQADEIQTRWPGITLPEGYVGCFEPASGILYSEAGIKAYRKAALAHGAKLVINSPVKNIDIHKDGVTIQTAYETFHAEKLILSAGAWTTKLLPTLNQAIIPIRKAIAWFECDESLFNHKQLPAFTFDLDDRTYYGFPSIYGSGVKVGRHDAGQVIDPDQVNREFGCYPEDEGDLRHLLSSFMPKAAGKIKQGKICMYSKTPDEHFILDHYPNHEHVFIAAGFSGHGFKFASVVGEILCELVTQGKTRHDISLFSIHRSDLKVQN